MDVSDDLLVPTAADEEARASPIVKSLAAVVGAIACGDGLVSPRRFETAIAAAQDIGNVLGEPNLTRVLALRALSSPQDMHACRRHIEAPCARPFCSRPSCRHALACGTPRR
jgi:hypothetical protein